MQFDEITYILPMYWASYIVNADYSGLEDNEQEEIDQFLAREGLGAASVQVSEDYFFKHTNDANNLGNDCCEYTFFLPVKES